MCSKRELWRGGEAVVWNQVVWARRCCWCPCAHSEGYEQVQEALDILADDTSQTPETRVAWRHAWMNWTQESSGIWYEILRHVNKVSLSLEDPGVTLNTAVDFLKSLVVVLEEREDSSTSIWEKKHWTGWTQQLQSCDTPYPQAKSGAYDDGTSPETVRDPRERFRVEVFLVIVDSLIAALNERLSTYHVVSNMFGFLGRLQPEAVTAVEVLVMKYQEDLESDLSAELTHFVVKFLDIIGTDKLQDCHGAGVKSSRQLLTFLFLHEQQLTQTFPNIEVMLRI